MPSIREVNLEKEKAQRIERLELSRRFGASLGVEGARRYNSQRRQQESSAMNEIKANLAKQREVEAQQRALAAAQNSLRRGEGIRSAMELAEGLAAKATVESSAWKAEKQLEAARYSVARKSAMLPSDQQIMTNEARIANREKAKAMELERSTKLLQRSRSSVPFTSLAVPLDAPHTSVVVAPVANSSQSVADVTAKFDAKRREELAQKEKALKEEQRKTKERAKAVLQEKRAEEELDRIEKENDMLLKKSMLDHAMRSLRPMASHDFQEQDARRSTQQASQAHKEFEAMFLNGPWSVESIKKYHVGPTIEPTTSDAVDGFIDDIEGFEVFQKANIEELLKGTPSVSLPVSELFAKQILPIEDENEGEEDPTPLVEAPLPINGEGYASTNSTELLAPIEHPLPPLPPPRHDVSNVSSSGEGSANVAAATVVEADQLAERNKQFLQQLAILQRRLATAKSVTAHMHNSVVDESDTSQDASESDDSVSVSPMSTPERPHSSRPSTAKLAMTTDQLRNAIRNMKLSNKHLDVSDSDATQSSSA